MEKDYESLYEEAFKNKEDLTEFATDFSEGDNLLKDTLLNLWNNNIRTFSCCKGHETEEYYIPSYLSIIIDEYSIGLIDNLYSKLYPEKKDVTFKIGNINANNFDAFTIYMRGDTKEYTLNLINKCIGMKATGNIDIDNSLSMLEYAKEMSLKNGIEITKDNVFLEFRNQEDDTTNMEFKTLDESIDGLYNIKDESHLFIICKNEDMDRIIDILKQNKKNR